MSRVATAVRLLMAVFTAWVAILPAGAGAATWTFTAVADGSVASTRPSTGYGSANRLLSSATRSAYVKFDVALPAGARAKRVRLWLYRTGRRGAGTSLWHAGSGWTESGLNWRHRPAATGRRLDRDRRTAPGWRRLRARLAGTGAQSFLLRGHGRVPSRYHSREARNGPRLVVRFTGSVADRCPVPRPQTTWRAPRSRPLTDAQAAACVARSGENRRENVKPNAKAPTAAELHAFRIARDAKGRTPAAYNPGFAFVTGSAARYGLRSTDDLIEWAAYKWGIPEDLVRAQMYVESSWSMLQKGDRRDWPTPVSNLYPAPAVIDADSVWESLGIAQLRWRHTVPWNPGIELLRWQSTGFALDYSQALVRYYYDGHCDWCGDGYVPGDADGAYRAYVSGSWTQGQWYADAVRRNAASRPWEPIPQP